LKNNGVWILRHYGENRRDQQKRWRRKDRKNGLALKKGGSSKGKGQSGSPERRTG